MAKAKKKADVVPPVTSAAPAAAATTATPTAPAAASAAATALAAGNYAAVRRLAAHGTDVERSEAQRMLPFVQVENTQLLVAVGALVVTLLVGAMLLRY
jgi:hypothetical protein